MFGRGGIQFSTRVMGLTEQVRRLLKGQFEITRWVRQFSLTAANKSITVLRRYPPKIAGSPYKRTYTLRSGWQVSSFSPLGGRAVVNSVNYAQYVHGDGEGEGQARIHVGRWPVARTVIEAEVERQTERLKDKLRSL